ncbi:MAG TPA: hypothetical protein VKC89_00655 [Patescibacteria group bacterium]|nr:hypothetical protein [Patescibacteria group bacterium]
MKQRELLFIVVSFFVLILIYMGFSVYHNSVTSTIPETLGTQILPISPTFDEKTISDLKKRNSIVPIYQLAPGQQQTPVASSSAKPSATPAPTKTATPSGGKL